jgi:hypothetical protein
MSTPSERLVFCSQYISLRKDKKFSLADELHMTALLIRWLEDTVESPPRRPGATPEERADDYLLACFVLSEALRVTADAAYSHTDHKELFPLLPRPAQSAWRRLLIQHLPHLPLPARLLVHQAVLRVESADTFPQSAQVIFADVLPLVQSGNFMVDIGRGQRLGLGYLIFMLLTSLCLQGLTVPNPVNFVQQLFSESHPSVPRHINLVMYRYLLDCFDFRGRCAEKGNLVDVGACTK